MKSLLPFVCSILVVSAPALSSPANASRGVLHTPQSSGARESASADVPRTTLDGNGFVLPAGWSIATKGMAVILSAPEGGSHIALVDVVAKDADSAVAAAWKAYDPSARWPLKLAADRPVRNGWERIRGYQYETSATDQRVVAAVSMRLGDHWTVAIRDMAEAVFGKRFSQVELIYGGLLPKGHSPETFAGKTAHKLDAARIDALRQFVEAARQEFGVPGLAVGIVQDGRVVLAEGFGVRALGKPDKVDADTLFMIASITKPLTTLMLAKLVDAGKFTWDTPVTEVLPTFKLGDAETTRRVRMKHLVCACTGLPRQDMEWTFEGERLTPDLVVATLAQMQPTAQFGELYQYSNLMAGSAGYAGGHVLHPQLELGAAYDAAMQALVFDPLGMKATTFDFARAQRGNHAAPHGDDINGNTVRSSIDLSYTSIPSRPDGGAWSSVNDLLRYVQMELDKGLLPDGKRYIAEAPLLARRTQQVATGNGTGYGMGLRIDRTPGTPLIHHGGVAFGGRAEMLWLPEHNVGAVILSNADTGGVRGLFQRRLLEVLFDGNPEAATNAPVLARLIRESGVAERKRLAVPAEAALADALATRYRSAELGTLDVVRSGGTTWFDFGGWKSEVATRRDEDGTIAFVTIAPSASGFEFVVADKNGKRAMVLRDEQHEYEFAETK